MSDEEFARYLHSGQFARLQESLPCYFAEAEYAFLSDRALEWTLREGIFQELIESIPTWFAEEETEEVVAARGSHPNDLTHPSAGPAAPDR